MKKETYLPLPDPLISDSGRRIGSAFEFFNIRRAEILDCFTREVYGALPPQPEGFRIEMLQERADALGGAALRREFRIVLENGGSRFSFDVLAYFPHTEKPVPAIVALNFCGNAAAATEADVLPVDAEHGTGADRWPFRQLIDDGVAVLTAARNDVFFDDPARRGDSVWRIFAPGCADDRSFTAISAWAGACRWLLEAAMRFPEVDPRRIWVHGHSRLGKTALWAAANEPRFAGVVSNDSGCMGASLCRDKGGESIRRIASVFPHWFVEAFDRWGDREAELPFDQHWLLALAAPRPLLVASATEDEWADPRNEYRAAAAVGEVYRLFGAEGIGGAEFPAPDVPLMGDGVGYCLRTGKHGVMPIDWKFVTEFIRRSDGK